MVKKLIFIIYTLIFVLISSLAIADSEHHIANFQFTTYEDGDAYIGEDWDDPNWVWDIESLYEAKTFGVENDFVWNDDSDNPTEIGECLNLPNDYIQICLEGLNVNNYGTYTFSIDPSADLSSAGEEWADLTAASTFFIHAPHDGLSINSINTDKIWLYKDADFSIHVFYQSDEGVQYATQIQDNSQHNLALIKYGNTELPVTIEGALNENFNLTISLKGDLVDESLKIGLSGDDPSIISRIGSTANKAEPSELIYNLSNPAFPYHQDSTLIGTKDEDHRTAYGLVIKNPDYNSELEQIVLSVPSEQVKAIISVKSPVTGDDVTADIPLGASISDSGILDYLDHTSLSHLLNQESLVFGEGNKFVRVMTSLTSMEDDYHSDVVLEADIDSIKYYYILDENIDLSQVSKSNPLHIKHLGKDLMITLIENDKIVVLDFPESITILEGSSIEVDTEFTEENSISFVSRGPLDENGYWQTTYSDAGTYTVTFGVDDGDGGLVSRIFTIIIKNDLDQDGTADEEDEDDDGDGLSDEEDNLKLYVNDINTNIKSLIITVEGSEDTSKIFTGTQIIEFKDGENSVMSFNFNFDINKLDISQLSITTQDDTATKGSLMIKGLILPGTTTKTVYVKDVSGTTNEICIKDAEISSISEISGQCNAADETLLTCSSTGGIEDGYKCTDLGDYYKVEGLKHSGIVEKEPLITTLKGKVGDVFRESILFKNHNSCIHEFQLSAQGKGGNEVIFDEQTFTIEPESEKRVYFTIKAKKAGETEIQIWSSGSCSGEGWGAGGAGISSRIHLIIEEDDDNEGSSSGRGTISRIEDETSSETCDPDWECYDWLACVNGIQTRICYDANKCGTNAGKPEEGRECVSTEEESEEIQTIMSAENKEKNSGANSVTGATFALEGGNIKGFAITTLILAMFVVGLMVTYFVKNHRKRSLGILP